MSKRRRGHDKKGGDQKEQKEEEEEEGKKAEEESLLMVDHFGELIFHALLRSSIFDCLNCVSPVERTVFEADCCL